MSKLKTKKETKAKKAVEAPKVERGAGVVEIPAKVFAALQRQDSEVRFMEATAKKAKRDFDEEEKRIIKLLEGGAVAAPDTIPFFVDEIERRNIQWKNVCIEEIGARAVDAIFNNWPKDKYKHIKFGQKPKGS